MSQTTSDQENGVTRFEIRSGTGIAGWQGCMCDSFRLSIECQFMTGSQWVAHMGGCVDYEVKS